MHPTVRPAGHPDLIDPVEIEVVVPVHAVEHCRHFPSQTIKLVVDKAALLRAIAVVIVDLADRSKTEADVGSILIAVQHRHTPGTL